MTCFRFCTAKILEESGQLKGLLTGKKTETGDSPAEKQAAIWWQRKTIRKAIRDAWPFVAADEPELG